MSACVWKANSDDSNIDTDTLTVLIVIPLTAKAIETEIRGANAYSGSLCKGQMQLCWQ